MPSFLRRFLKEQKGQSLVEILVGLAIGALLIGTATVGVIFVLKSSTTNQNLSAGNDLTQGLLDNVRSFTAANWSGLYNLTHGASSAYFIVASGTALIAAPGEEGILGSDITNGLVGHWGFDESTGTIAYDTTGNSYNGLITFTASSSRATSTCQVSYCLILGGNGDGVSLGSFTGYDTPSFSVSLWIRPMSYKTSIGGVNGNIFMGRENYAVSGFRAGIDGTGSVGQLKFWTTQSGGTLTLSSGDTLLSTSSIAFYHIMITYDSTSSNGSLYINGNLVSSSSGTYIPPSGRTLGIDSAIGGVNFLNAYFDDVRWYSRALSASEVLQLYKSQPFSRYFYVQDVCRTNDASSSIDGNAPCQGGDWDDPLTQRVTAVTQWNAGPSTDQTTLSTYLARYQNFTLRQSDWSGGSGATGTYAIPNTQYASGTNVTGTSTLGSFQMQNLTQQ